MAHSSSLELTGLQLKLEVKVELSGVRGLELTGVTRANQPQPAGRSQPDTETGWWIMLVYKLGSDTKIILAGWNRMSIQILDSGFQNKHSKNFLNLRSGSLAWTGGGCDCWRGGSPEEAPGPAPAGSPWQPAP